MKCTLVSSRAENIQEAYREITNTIKSNNIEYDFVIIAVSDKYDLHQIAKIEEIADDKYFIFNAIDSFCNDEIIHNGVVALFIKFEREGSIECFTQEHISTQRDRVYKETVSYLKKREDDFHLIITGICNNQIASFIEELSYSGIKIDNIQGGVSSGPEIDGYIRTWQLYKGELIKDGFTIISFSNVEMATSIAMGFHPVGVRYEVTEADGYNIYTVDNKPFVETIDMLSKDIYNFKNEYLWYTPIIVLDESSNDLMTLRTFKSKKRDSVEFYGPIKKGQKIRLTYGEREMILDADEKSAKSIKEKISTPELILNFSCIARQYILENGQLDENRIYIKYLNAPLFGFFTYGEIGHSPNMSSLQFYNETSLLTAIRER